MENDPIKRSMEKLQPLLTGETIGDPQQADELRRWLGLDLGQRRISGPVIRNFSPKIVCGSGRSGSTLARRMLGSHPEIYAGPESYLFLPLELNLNELSEKFSIDLPALEKLHANAHGRSEFIKGFATHLLEISGMAIWIDKTVRNTLVADEIFRVFPHSQMIFIVRHPLDTVASLKGHRKYRLGSDGQRELTGWNQPLSFCIDRWLKAAEVLEDLKKKGKQVLVVRYEDMVTNPQLEATRMAEFLGLSFHPDMISNVQSDAAKADWFNEKYMVQNPNAFKPIIDRRGAYKEVLTQDEINTVLEHTGSLAERFGYGAHPVTDTMPRFLSHHRTRAPELIHEPEIIKLFESAHLQTFLRSSLREVLRLHYHGVVNQPQKVYLQTGGVYDRIIAMPAALGSERLIKGLKWIGSESGNVLRGIDRAHSLIILNDPETHEPRYCLDGTLISTLRTFAMSLLALDLFHSEPTNVGILGAGKLGLTHLHYLKQTYPSIKSLMVATSRSRDAILAEGLDGSSFDIVPTEELVARSDVIISLTSKTGPYISDEEIGDNCRLIVNISLVDFAHDVITNSDHIVVDDYRQNAKAPKPFKDCLDRGLLVGRRIYEMGEVLSYPQVISSSGRVFVNPIGMGIEDLHLADALIQMRLQQDLR